MTRHQPDVDDDPYAFDYEALERADASALAPPPEVDARENAEYSRLDGRRRRMTLLFEIARSLLGGVVFIAFSVGACIWWIPGLMTDDVYRACEAIARAMLACSFVASLVFLRDFCATLPRELLQATPFAASAPGLIPVYRFVWYWRRFRRLDEPADAALVAEFGAGTARCGSRKFATRAFVLFLCALATAFYLSVASVSGFALPKIVDNFRMILVGEDLALVESRRLLTAYLLLRAFVLASFGSHLGACARMLSTSLRLVERRLDSVFE